MRPHIGAVIVHEDGNVAEHLHALSVRVVSECVPLGEKCELQNALDFHVVCEFSSRLLHSSRFALHQLLWPIMPAFSRRAYTQSLEQHIILKPASLCATELAETVCLFA